MDLFSSVVASLGSVSLAQWLVLIGVACAYLWRQHMAAFRQYGDIPQVKPHWFLGNKSFGGEPMRDTYLNHYKALAGHRFGIFWSGNRVQIFLRDLDLIKKVQVGDFDNFTDLGFNPPEYMKKVGNQFGVADMLGEPWKKMKRMVTPPFSVPRLKKTVPAMNAAAKKLRDYLQRNVNNEFVDASNFTRKFYMSSIASVVFGTEIDCFGKTESQFEKQGNNLLNLTNFIIVDTFPTLAAFLRLKFINGAPDKFFSNLCKQIVRQRNNSKLEYKDVLSNLMDVAKENPDMTDEMMYKTCVQFFTDGYETAAQSISVLMYYLTIRPDIQERLQDEIDNVFEQKNEDENIEQKDLNEMPYLDQVLSEGLRIGCVAFTNRTCTKDWKIPGDNFVIKKGTIVVIPTVGLHYDPKYWTDPLKFDPERFSSENRGSIDPVTFQPFGFGPRACLGQNLLKLETKIMLIQIMRNFSFAPYGSMPEDIAWDVATLIGPSSVKLKLASRSR